MCIACGDGVKLPNGWKCDVCGRVNESSISAGSMLREELRAVIRRYGQESDVTVYQLIGCLEVVKQDILDMLESKK